jgi:hypothetical protein
VRATLAQASYVLVVTVVATCGVVTGSTATIVVAALLALPSSVLAIVGYYLAYGLLALVPGANPSIATGSGSCGVGGACQETSTGDPPFWFTLTTEVGLVIALTAAALLNVVLLRLVLRRRRRSVPVDDDSRPAAQAC